jgi:chitin synthase
MAEDRRPQLPSFNSHTSGEQDPFADRPHHLAFQEPPPSAYASTTSLTLNGEFGGRVGDYDDDEVEKVPLTSGGLYPPG